MTAFADLAAAVRRGEMGRGTAVRTPYGSRLICYADITASGRFLGFVEAWLDRIRPFYANTHTAVSTTGRMMTRLREEARCVIRRSVNAGPEDVVVFVGSGSTAAVNKLVGLLGLRIPEPLERAYRLSRHIPPAERPVVLVGPYEHHSNELPWFESIADIVEVGLDSRGGVDIADLEAKLAAHEDRPLRFGAFSAASNVTGILTDVRAVARTLHRFGAYALFDFASAGPYVPIDMHPSSSEERIDALFLSTHKFIGAPGGSGVLVAHKDLFRSRVPERPGGGTVDYVATFDGLAVDYVASLDEREEGGTPSILGDVRAGTAFLVKEALVPERILQHERKLAALVLRRLSSHPRLRVYGPGEERTRLATISLNVDGLHHAFVSTLLDHLFGIQSRSGCSCAGPYGHRLLGISASTSEAYRRLIAEGLLGMKPGWVRLSFPPYFSEEDVEFVLRAVEFVADHGAAFLSDYRFGWRDGVWRHLDGPAVEGEAISLTVDALAEAMLGGSIADVEQPVSEERLRSERERYLGEAKRLAAELAAGRGARSTETSHPTVRDDVDALVWFRYQHTDEPPRARPGLDWPLEEALTVADDSRKGTQRCSTGR